MVAISAVTPAAAGLAIPIYYNTFESHQILANISWGTPASEPISTVVDTGSYGYWVFGPNATVNSGSPYLGVLGPCNQTASPFFNYPESTTHSGPYNSGAAYAYGGNGKIVSCPKTVNDTMSFGVSGFPAIENIQVSTCDFMLIKDRATTCNGAYYAKSILGLSPMKPISGGPVFRTNLKNQGRLDHQVFSMWVDEVADSVREAHRGTLFFGEPPSDKHVGDIATLNNTRAADGFYYAVVPEIRASRIGGDGSDKKTISVVTPHSGVIPDCLVDSGAWGIRLPTNQSEFFAVSGLEADSPFVRPRYPAPCDQIPYDEGFDVVYKGMDGKSATIRISYRDLATGPGRAPNTCALEMELEGPDCTLGGTFFASAFTVFNDEEKTIQVAQGAMAAQGPTQK